MSRFLSGVFSVIAVGVVLIAYGLLSPQASAFNTPHGLDPYGRPMAVADERLMLNDPEAVRFAYANGYRPAPTYQYAAYESPQAQYVAYAPPQTVALPVRPVQTIVEAPAQRVVTRTVERAPRRDWRKTALVIGGSTAAGAGVGGAIGGKRGALIGAAIGGGASTLYESTK